MAVELGKLIAEVKENIEFEEISHKSIAIDAYNTIYQFLSIIRQPDGTPLTDSKNRVTSHLSGLLYRVANLLEYDITPVFIFDGIPSAMKKKTLEARMNRRNEAQKEWEKAKGEGLMEEARMHAMASTRIDKYIVDSSKELLGYMGIPWMQAPSEGEAQGAYLVKKGLVYASASQDYDSFLFGADTVLRNLTVTGKRKLPKKNIYIDISLERIFLNDLLSNLGIDRNQLIWLGILMGTDFDNGIKGIGPKTALKVVKEKRSLKDVVDFVNEKYKEGFDVDPFDVERIFKEPDIREMEKEEFDKIAREAKLEKEKLISFMCDEHDFSRERVTKFADKLSEIKGKKGQKGINNWF